MEVGVSCCNLRKTNTFPTCIQTVNNASTFMIKEKKINAIITVTDMLSFCFIEENKAGGKKQVCIAVSFKITLHGYGNN